MLGVVGVVGAAGAGRWTPPLAAQERGGDEMRLLRDAAERESRGDYPGAERVLRRVLRLRPTSSGALFALERVLRAQGRVGEVLPVADSLLARDPSASGVRQLELRVLEEVDSLSGVETAAEAWLTADARRLRGLGIDGGDADVRGVLGARAPGPPEGVEGPGASLEHAYALLDRGEITPARQALLAALPGLPPERGTEALQLAGLLGRLDPKGARRLARAEALAHRGRPLLAVAALEDHLEELSAGNRGAALAEVARLAERAGRAETAARLRVRILAEYADAPESADAALLLARYRARLPEGREEAVRILRDLITRRPDAAAAPAARRDLERLTGGRGGSEP